MEVTDHEKRKARKAFVSKLARVERQDMVAEVKGNRCTACGFTYDPVCIDLHHIDPTTKVASISWLVRNGTMAQLKAELKKVVPICANCHRLRTAYGYDRMG